MPGTIVRPVGLLSDSPQSRPNRQAFLGRELFVQRVLIDVNKIERTFHKTQSVEPIGIPGESPCITTAN